MFIKSPMVNASKVFLCKVDPQLVFIFKESLCFHLHFCQHPFGLLSLSLKSCCLFHLPSPALPLLFTSVTQAMASSSTPGSSSRQISPGVSERDPEREDANKSSCSSCKAFLKSTSGAEITDVKSLILLVGSSAGQMSIEVCAMAASSRPESGIATIMYRHLPNLELQQSLLVMREALDYPLWSDSINCIRHHEHQGWILKSEQLLEGIGHLLILFQIEKKKLCVNPLPRKNHNHKESSCKKRRSKQQNVVNDKSKTNSI